MWRLSRVVGRSGIPALLLAAVAGPAVAQPINDPFATGGKGGEWAVTAGAGAALRPTFEGSDRYFVTPIPFVTTGPASQTARRAAS